MSARLVIVRSLSIWESKYSPSVELGFEDCPLDLQMVILLTYETIRRVNLYR